MDKSVLDLLKDKKLFNIQKLKYTKSNNMPVKHYHEHYEIYYQLSGERHYFIKDRTYLVRKGDLVLINLNELHKTSMAATPTYERILINFKKDFLCGLANTEDNFDLLSCFTAENSLIRLSMPEQTFVENLLFKLIKENDNAALGSSIYLKILLVELLIFFNRYLLQHNFKQFDYPNSLHKKISEIAKYINANYAQRLTLTDVSNIFFLSPYYLSRSFKEVTGFTFIEYINNIKIKESQRFLRETKLNITEISEKVGFESSTHFGRVFKNITGFSPLNYRKMNHL